MKPGAVAIELDLVQPLAAIWRHGCEHGDAWTDEGGTQGHGSTAAPESERKAPALAELGLEGTEGTGSRGVEPCTCTDNAAPRDLVPMWRADFRGQVLRVELLANARS